MTWQFWKKKNKENIDLFEYGRPHLVMSTQLILDDTDIHYMELPENAIPVFKLANKYFYEGRNSLLNFGSHYEGWEEESIKSYMNAIENYQKILNLIGGSSHPAVYIFYNIGTTYLYCGSQILIKNLEKNTNSQEFVPELSESVKYLERTLDLKNRQYFLASFNLGVA